MNTRKALQVLNLNIPFRLADLSKAYRFAAQKNHPDIHPESEKAKQTEIFIEIKAAYEYLKKNYHRIHAAELPLKRNENRGIIEIPNTWFYRDLENLFQLFFWMFRISLEKFSWTKNRVMGLVYTALLGMSSPVLLFLAFLFLPIYLIYISGLEALGQVPKPHYNDSWLTLFLRIFPIFIFNILAIWVGNKFIGFHWISDVLCLISGLAIGLMNLMMTYEGLLVIKRKCRSIR